MTALEWQVWVPFVERKIIKLLAEEILKRGHSISVYDGEENALNKSTDLNAILNEVGSTEVTVFTLHSGGGVQGWFTLIHGNYEDVISDYSVTGDCNDIFNTCAEAHNDRSE